MYSCVARQRSVVEIDGAAPRHCDDFFRQHPQVRDAEQIVEFKPAERLREIFVRAYESYIVTRGPARCVLVPRHERQNLMSAFDQGIGTLKGKRIFADDDTREAHEYHPRLIDLTTARIRVALRYLKSVAANRSLSGGLRSFSFVIFVEYGCRLLRSLRAIRYAYRESVRILLSASSFMSIDLHQEADSKR